MLFRFLAVRGATPMERVVRSLAMVGVIILVIWAFWLNNQRVVARLNLEKSFWDETGQMDESGREFAREFVEALDKEMGRTAYVHVRLGEAVIPKGLDDEDLYLAVSPARQEVALHLPADLDRPEDQALADYLVREHFKGNWDHWQRGLKTGLVMLWEHLAGDAPVASKHVMDDTGLLDQDQVLALDRFGADLADTYGQQLLVRLAPDPDLPEGLDPVTLYIGLWPEDGSVVLRLPPMLEKALGPDVEPELAAILGTALESGEWFGGLQTALDRIWTELDGKERTW